VITVANRPYQPFGGAEQLFYCRDKEILFEGPAGTGKTRGLLEKIFFCAQKWANSRHLLVRKTRKSMTESVLVTFEEKVIPVGFPIGSNVQRSHRHSYDLPNGSVIVIDGMDNADRIMSTEFDTISYFEATEGFEDDHEKLTTRLRNGVMPFQQIISDCNPGAPTHFLNQRANAGKMTRILSRHEDNPAITEGYLNTLRSLTGARRLRLYEGKWASQEGLVYNFDPAIHMVKPFPIPSDWKRYRVIDFGYKNPFVCQWWALDNDNRPHLYREIYYTERLVSDHAKQIVSLSEGETYELTLADHDAEDRATLEREGIKTKPAQKAVTSGIQAVEDLLRKKADGKAGMVVFYDTLVERDPKLTETKRPTCTREELDSYSYPKGQDGKTAKEEPVKADDHGMDCLKYLALELKNPTTVKQPPVRFNF